MTDDVALLVLKDNYDQTLTLSVAQSRAAKDLDAHGRFMRELNRADASTARWNSCPTTRSFASALKATKV